MAVHLSVAPANSRRVSGVVRAQRSGLGVLGVTVQLIAASSTASGAANPPPVTTAADGSYSLDVAPGIYTALFTPSRSDSVLCYGWFGKADPFAKGDPEGHRVVANRDLPAIDIDLLTGRFITGRVFDVDTGTPIARDETNMFRIQPTRAGRQAAGSLSWGIPDARGRYSVWVPAGIYELTAISFDHHLSKTRVVTVQGADASGVDFTMQRRPSPNRRPP